MDPSITVQRSLPCHAHSGGSSRNLEKGVQPHSKNQIVVLANDMVTVVA